MASKPAEPSRQWFFNGSSSPEDYIINLNLDAASQPIDVQVYLECVARAERIRRLPNGPPTKLPYDVYGPQLDVVADGLQHLKDASRTKEEGLWLDSADITPEDMAKFPLNPWLATLVRTGRLEQVGTKLEGDLWAPGIHDNVVYGNVRIAFPTHLDTPVPRNSWITATTEVYGRSHPAIIFARDYELWTDEEELVDDFRHVLPMTGLRHTMEPVLPCTAVEQQLFDSNPSRYDANRWALTRRGHPQTVWPKGYLEWRIERARREDAEREAEAKANDAQQPAE